jgi:hypothetical protein
MSVTPSAVLAACAQVGMDPATLRGHQVNDVEVVLTLASGAELRLRLSALPARYEVLWPETTVPVGRAPEVA